MKTARKGGKDQTNIKQCARDYGYYTKDVTQTMLDIPILLDEKISLFGDPVYSHNWHIYVNDPPGI